MTGVKIIETKSVPGMKENAKNNYSESLKSLHRIGVEIIQELRQHVDSEDEF